MRAIDIFNCGIAALSMLAASGSAIDARAQAGHMNHNTGDNTGAGKRIELGTSVAVDASGRLWAASKEADGDAQYVVLQASDDGGGTWSAPRRVQQQPEPVAADGENRPKLAFGTQGELYISYTKPLAKPYTGEIRFVRSLDGGKTFLPPVTVHANRDEITHRFDAMLVDRSGRIYIAWIDKRDGIAAAAHKGKYAGAALYYAVSEDKGASFRGDYKIADHSCECCRIALALGPDGNPVAMWRHVFAPNMRDHAMAELRPDGKAGPLARASFDNWRIDACPHHGPSLAFGDDGIRHQVWFSMRDGDGGIFYASATPGGKPGPERRLGAANAEHADVAVAGKRVALAWKQFDGASTAIFGKASNDGGATWEDMELARTAGASDQPHLLTTPAGIVLAWRTQAEGIRIVPVKGGQ
ncbi:MAG TPA: sialidase family protein [Noviherbaspirillum sp.]|uniref:sialidase family protein n=1 Tax=Noviherbaspirillum sp. TaxID=1926288 RepID=UPI002B46CC3C|nr:sialidase family protein [Noviherbaspirillum sp.]HJV87644.1 sialidase family protein [Noviherbaspirillum sp.]